MMGAPLPDEIPDVDQWEDEPGKFDEPDEGPLAGEKEPAAEEEPHAGGPRDGRACSHVLDTNAVCTLCGLAFGLDVAALDDAVKVAAHGRQLASDGVRFLLDGIVPDYGMLGMLVAYAKVGKTTLGHAMGAAVANGEDFAARPTKQSRVLYVAAEDPPEYTAWLARHLVTQPGAMTFYRRSVVLNDDGLARIAATVKAGAYGFVLIASWQAVIRGLVKDENDNAGAVVVVERVKAAARQSGIPWLIDAHAGRGEDQKDDADPIRALRGASAAAGAADYILWLRYADGTFGTRRRLSGRGRFVTLPPVTLAYDEGSGAYDFVGSTKDATRESTWRQILETGALTAEPRSVDAIARTAGLVAPETKVAGGVRRAIMDALRDREGVTRTESTYRGRKVVLFALAPEPTE